MTRSLRNGLLLVLVLPAVLAAAKDWNQWRGPRRDGVQPASPALLAELPGEGLAPVWTSEEIPSGFNGGWSSPVVAGGRVYQYVHTKAQKPGTTIPQRKYPWLPPEKRGHLTDEEYAQYEINRRDEDEQIAGFYEFRERLYCLDAADGKTVWRNDRPSIYTRFLHSGSPAVIAGRIYVLAPGRVVRAIDAATGADLWQTRLPGEFRDEYMMSSFAVIDGVALVLAGHLVALDAADGRLLWEGDRQATHGTHSSPVVWEHAGTAYAIANVGGGKTACFEPATGKTLWSIDSEAELSTPVVAGDRLITYGNSRRKGLRCYALSPQGAELVWHYQRVADKGSSPVVYDGHVYVQGERRLACVELATGRECWTGSLDRESPQYTSLVAADGKIFYGYDGLVAFAADPQQFTLLMDARFDASGLMATEAFLRTKHGIDALERESDGGAERAQKAYQEKIVRQGPVRCTTPALSDGFLYVRFPNRVCCYDLRTAPKR